MPTSTLVFYSKKELSFYYEFSESMLFSFGIYFGVYSPGRVKFELAILFTF